MAERDFLEKEIKYDPTPISITQNSFQNATEVFVSLQHETPTFSIQRFREVPFSVIKYWCREWNKTVSYPFSFFKISVSQVPWNQGVASRLVEGIQRITERCNTKCITSFFRAF